MAVLPQGGLEPGLEAGGPRHAKSSFSSRPSSFAMTAADLPLDSQFRTASTLKVAPNLRRAFAGDALLMVSMPLGPLAHRPRNRSNLSRLRSSLSFLLQGSGLAGTMQLKLTATSAGPSSTGVSPVADAVGCPHRTVNRKSSQVGEPAGLPVRPKQARRLRYVGLHLHRSG